MFVVSSGAAASLTAGSGYTARLCRQQQQQQRYASPRAALPRSAFAGADGCGGSSQRAILGNRPRLAAAQRPLSVSASAGAGASSSLVDLRGKRALVTGVANNRSIAYGIAQALKEGGAEIGITYLPVNERAESKVRKLVESLEPTLFHPCDVQSRSDIEALFEQVRSTWGGVDILVHCLAFASRGDLEGDFSKTSRDGFNLAMNVSTYSLIEMCGAAKELFNAHASVVTLSYLGAERVVPNYNVMGVAKAGLECSVRYLAAELGPAKGVRVNGISAGPIRTLASSAIGGITTMIKNVEENAPLRRTVTQNEVGNAAAFLASEAASGITGQIVYVDSGYATMGSPVFESSSSS